MTFASQSVTTFTLAALLSTTVLGQNNTSEAMSPLVPNSTSNVPVPPSRPEMDPSRANIALQFFIEQAQSGSDYAQLSLGETYLEGIVVPQNLVEAYAWLSTAHAQGLDEAQPLRDLAWATMTSDERQLALALALNYQKWHLP